MVIGGVEVLELLEGRQHVEFEKMIVAHIYVPQPMTATAALAKWK